MSVRNPKAFLYMKKAKAGAPKKPKPRTPSWEGIVCFGQVQIPMAMFVATEEKRSNLVKLDKRDLQLVGNSTYNKSSLKPVDKEDVVSGIQMSDGSCIALNLADLAVVMPKTTHVVTIESFVSPSEVPPAHYLRSYHLLPTNAAAKPYVLLMEAMSGTKLVGLARIVVATRQYIALIKPEAGGLTLHLLRWASEVRPVVGAVEVPIEEQELTLAKRLMRSMAKPWDVSSWNDAEYTAKLADLAAMKAAAPGEPGKPLPGEEMPSQPQGLDLKGLLKASLKGSVSVKAKSTGQGVAKAPLANKVPVEKKREATSTASSRRKKTA